MNLSIYPPSQMMWLLIFTVCIVAIYYTWVRKPADKSKDASETANPKS